MSVKDSIAKLLVDSDFTSCFTKPVSALLCEEPIVVVEGGFERESRLTEEERGSVVATVFVVREDAGESGVVALAAEHAVRCVDWEPYADAAPYRIVGIDTTVPAYEGDDASGRAVWSFKVTCTVVRGL